MDDLGFNFRAVITAFFLAVVVKTVVEYFADPLLVKFKLDRLWLRYIAGGIGFVLAYAGRVDLFPGLFPEAPWISRVLTSLLIAGGANLLYDTIKALKEMAGSLRELAVGQQAAAQMQARELAAAGYTPFEPLIGSTYLGGGRYSHPGLGPVGTPIESPGDGTVVEVTAEGVRATFQGGEPTDQTSLQPDQ